MLEDLLINPFVIKFVISNLGPIHWIVFASWSMNYCKLCVKSNLLHFPLLVSGEISREGLLNILISVWELEYLRIKILFLLWNLQSDFRLFNVFPKHIESILGEFEVT